MAECPHDKEGFFRQKSVVCLGKGGDKAVNASVLHGLGLCAVGIWIFIESLSIRSLGYDALDSPFFPKLGAALLIIFGAALAITSLFKKDEKPKRDRSTQGYTKIVIYMCMLVVYAVVIKQIGFTLTTIFFVAASFLIMTRDRNIKEITYSIIFASLTTFAFWYIFEKGLKVMLP